MLFKTKNWQRVSDIPLKQQLKKAERNNKLRAILLVSPLFLFISINFIYPIGQFLYRSVDNSLYYQALPNTMDAIQDWDSGGLPGERVYHAIASDIKKGYGADTDISKVARSLNYRFSGARGNILKTARHLKKIPLEEFANISWSEKLPQLNDLWSDRLFWAQLKAQSKNLTFSHYLHASDLTINESFDVARVEESSRIHILLFERTFYIAFLITLLCLLFGYPLAYLLATLPLRISNLLMICVLLPFWTSLLVRTSSWIVLLQDQGVINSLLVWLGIIADEGRLSLINNQTGTIIAMTHILMPFMILPLYATMKGISSSYIRAAVSLGSHPFRAFFNIYVPLTLPGIGAGIILVFILSIGYYITPALVGGSSGQLISNIIAYHMKNSLNWGLASALSMLLLCSIIVLYCLYYIASKLLEKMQQHSLK